MNLGLQGRVAIVPAASQGLGKAAATGLVQEGASVVICARDRKRVLAAGKEISRWIRGKKQSVLPLVADVTKPKDIRRVVAAAVGEFGRIDILVTNAGGPPPGTFDGLDDEAWHAGVQLTLMSVVRFIREVLPHMKKRSWGRIINITSLTVKQPANDLVVSSTLRPGVVGLAKVLANIYGGDGITVNNVAPGFMATARQVELSELRAKKQGVAVRDYVAELARDIPLGRLGEPRELADAIVFLASERASYITGATLSVDGGLVKGLQ
jgi:3-oxoacyl-[acyl-carrier protein] reductase